MAMETTPVVSAAQQPTVSAAAAAMAAQMSFQQPTVSAALQLAPIVTAAATIQVVSGPDGRQYQVVMTSEGQKLLPIQFHHQLQ